METFAHEAMPTLSGSTSIQPPAAATARPAPRRPPAKRRADPAAELAEKMLSVLRSQRTLGGEAYPLALGELGRLTDPSASPAALLAAAAKRKAFAGHVALVKTKSSKCPPKLAIESPLALLDDVEELAASPQTVEFALRGMRTPTIRARTIADIGNWVAARLKQPLRAVLQRQLEGDSLPATVAWLPIGRPKLFLIDDLRPPELRGRLAKPPEDRLPGAAPAGAAESGPCRPPEEDSRDFAAAFEAAFTRFDRQQGGKNLVSLVDLRAALPEFTRAEFDAGLTHLRGARRFSLSAAESIHGIQPQERAAGIEETGSLLLYVSRRSD